jgi:heme A synthase
MDSVAARAGADEAALARFRRLVTLTIAATFVLVLIGGVVRVSDSGLGCGPPGSGTHGWPLCDGGLVPAASAESAIEYTHRVAAGVVGVLIAICVWQALRNLRSHRWLVRGSIAAGVLVVVQAVLGGLTVEEGLDEALVAAHLGLAMLLLGLLLLLRRGAEPQTDAAPAAGGQGLRVLAVVSATLLLATIVAGGYVAGTEKEGTPGEPVAGQAHVACGTGVDADHFPACNGEFPGFGQSRLADIQVIHRTLMYLTAIAIIALVAVAVRDRVRTGAFLLAGALLVLQILLGAANVWFDKHAGLIVGHLTLATLLWGAVVYASATLIPVSSPARLAVGRGEAAGATA